MSAPIPTPMPAAFMDCTTEAVLFRSPPHTLLGKRGKRMQKRWRMDQGYTRCYKQPGNHALVLAGIVLAGTGAVLLFLCIPGWAWVALIGFALICAGLLLLRLGKGGR